MKRVELLEIHTKRYFIALPRDLAPNDGIRQPMRFSHSLQLFHSFSLPLSISLSISHNTHSNSTYRTDKHTSTLTLILSFSPFLPYPTLSLSLSLSHRHSFTDSFSPSLPLSLAFPHSYYLCLPIFLLHKPWGWSSSTSNKFFSTYSNTRYSLPVV